MSLSFCFISPATNMLEGWYIFHFKDRIHSFLWSTKTFLNDIRKARYKQNNIGYEISRIGNNKQYNILKSDTAAMYA